MNWIDLQSDDGHLQAVIAELAFAKAERLGVDPQTATVSQVFNSTSRINHIYEAYGGSFLNRFIDEFQTISLHQWIDPANVIAGTSKDTVIPLYYGSDVWPVIADDVDADGPRATAIHPTETGFAGYVSRYPEPGDIFGHWIIEDCRAMMDFMTRWKMRVATLSDNKPYMRFTGYTGGSNFYADASIDFYVWWRDEDTGEPVTGLWSLVQTVPYVAGTLDPVIGTTITIPTGYQFGGALGVARFDFQKMSE